MTVAERKLRGQLVAQVQAARETLRGWKDGYVFPALQRLAYRIEESETVLKDVPYREDVK